jgi:Holliday junction resolvase
MSGNHSRMKGYRYEREIVDYMLEGGLRCRRVPLSGATEHDKDDVVVTTDWGEYRLECKRRKALPTWLTTALKPCYAVAFREDRGETYVLLRLSDFRGLLQ